MTFPKRQKYGQNVNPKEKIKTMKQQLEEGDFHKEFKNVGPHEGPEDSEAVSVEE